MKRAVLVLMIVVFALVTVIPAFAMPQDFHGVTIPQVGEMEAGSMKAGMLLHYAPLNAGRVRVSSSSGVNSGF